MKRTVFISLILAFAFFSPAHRAALTQENYDIEITAQGILARVDKIMDYPRGLIKGRVKHITPDGTASNIDFEIAAEKDEYLIKFSSKERGEQLNVLYTMKGEDIWVFNNHTLKVYHKTGVDKYDTVLGTNFFYIDFASADFQSNYTATIEGESTYKGYKVYQLKLKPILKGGEYGYLTLLVSKDKFIPLRIDFHDKDNAIFKFMNIVKVKEKDNMIVPLRYDMLNIKTGTVTIVSFFEFDDTVKFKKDIFRPEKLGE